MKIKPIGFWRSYQEKSLPNPSNFVDPTWDDNEKQIVINHLKNGFRMPYAMGGLSWCRFLCEQEYCGALEFTDGYYLWPEGLLHYVQNHEVKLPEEFIAHCKSYRKPNTLYFDKNREYSFDRDWWINQPPFTLKGPESFTMPREYDDEFIQKNAESCVIEINLELLDKSEKIAFLKQISKTVHISVVDLFKLAQGSSNITLEVKRTIYQSLKRLDTDFAKRIEVKEWILL